MAVKKNNDEQLKRRSLEHEDATGFFSLVKAQIKQPAFKRNLMMSFLGAVLYALVFRFSLSIVAAPWLYLSVLLGATAFVALQLYLWLQHEDNYMGGVKLTHQESIWLFFIRIAVTYAGALIASYYLIDRMGLEALPVTVLIAAALFFGHLGMSFIPYPILLYIIFGLMTTVVSIASFNGMNFLLFGTVTGGGGDFGWLVPKTVSWVLAVLFAYLTNRKLVFNAQGNFWHEMFKFFLARIASGLVVEFLGLYVLENLIGIDRDVSNMILSVIVVIVNYVFSKLFVFRKN